MSPSIENNMKQILKNIINYYGQSICDDQRKLKALLMDKCPQKKLEINLLLNALKARIPFDLVNSQVNIPPELLFAKSEEKLKKTFGLEATKASWAVSSWAFALCIIKNNLPVMVPEDSVENIKNIQQNPYITMELDDLLLDYKNLPNNLKVKIQGVMSQNCIEDNENFKLKKSDENYIVAVDTSRLPLEMKKDLMKLIPYAYNSFSFWVERLMTRPFSEITVYGYVVKDKKIIKADKVEIREISHDEFCKKCKK